MKKMKEMKKMKKMNEGVKTERLHFCETLWKFKKMKMRIFLNMVVMLLLFSCKSTQYPAHNSMNSLDWQGVYAGTLPCADCAGIHTMLKLNRDLTYELETQYMGKSEQAQKTTGKFHWKKDGSKITLEGKEQAYFVGENYIKQLDPQGNIITGAFADRYILSKNPSPIVEKYWKLVSIDGKTISPSDKQIKEPHMILKAFDKSVNGNGGCNSFFGSYELAGENHISFSKIGATKMACQNMAVENVFFKALEQADQYTVVNDTLFLNNASKILLARFEAVYLK